MGSPAADDIRDAEILDLQHRLKALEKRVRWLEDQLGANVPFIGRPPRGGSCPPSVAPIYHGLASRRRD